MQNRKNLTTIISAAIITMLSGIVSPLSALSAKELTIERIYSSPSLTGSSMRGLKMSPDGTRVTYLKGKQSDYETLDLWEYNLTSKKHQLLFDSNDLQTEPVELSDEEKARRERMRLRGKGIVSYQWSKDGKALLFPLGGDIFYYKLGEKKARKLIETPEFETDIRFSPKGHFVSYIRNQNLFVFDLKKNKEMQLTTEGGGLIKMGMAEFVAQEEMDRMTGYWWSPDESKIALTKVDESPVEAVTRSEIYADEIKVVSQRYPFAGKANVKIELGILSLNTRKIHWVDLGKNQDIYLPRVKWTRDSNKLTYQLQSRDQKSLELRLVEYPSLKQSTLLTEHSDSWVNLHKDLYFLKHQNAFIWASERDGFKHLYLYQQDGKLIRQLTDGEWVVDALIKVDEKTHKVWFSGRKDTPLERHLYQVSLEGGEIKRISREKGYHSFVVAKSGGIYIDYFSSITTPSQVSLRNSQGELVQWLNQNKIDGKHPLYEYMSDWITPKLGKFKSSDGVDLYYRLYKPANFSPTKKYPVLVYLYGGPHAQMVTNSWGNYFLQYMAQQGYVVFTLDNRGSNYRGKKFEDSLYRAMGTKEVDDQIEGVKFLYQYPWVDRDKIGVHGHSYGGYMTLMTMFKAGKYFKAGVAGAPVTDWRLYDTHYTERYMGDPVKDKAAYDASSVFPYATQLKNPLLIYHGMADDNVLFKNSTRLYKLLQDNNIQFYMMDYPGKKHGIRGKQTSMHRAHMIKNFFDQQFAMSRR